MAANKNKSSKGDSDAVESGNVLPGTPDPLADYKSAITNLTAAREKVTTLRALEVSLRADADGIATAREKLLADSVTTGEEDGAVEELTRLRSRSELFERKIADVSGRLEAAERTRDAAFAQCTTALVGLWRNFYNWNFGRAKAHVAEQLVPGTGMGLIEQTTLMSKPVAAIRALEPSLNEPGALLESAQRLLAAVEREPAFPVPPLQPREPTASTIQDTFGLPYADRGWSVRQLEEEFAKIRLEDPALDYSAAYRVMRQRHPQLFVPPPRNEPELNQPMEWRAPMIGSTTQ